MAKGAADDAENERRKSVEIAIADSRIEGFPPPEQWELEILAAYIRGDIEADDLVNVIKNGLIETGFATKQAAPILKTAQ